MGQGDCVYRSFSDRMSNTAAREHLGGLIAGSGVWRDVMRYANGILTPAEPAIDLVRILSEGTYTSFPQALKEFVSNAFDADATRVDIQVDEEATGITIRDNGEGMNLTDFGDAFASIARSGRATEGLKRGRTASGRVKIGKFGLGTLAVVATCDRLTVRSTKNGSREGFVAKLDIKALRRHFGKGENLSQVWRFEVEKWNTELSSTHFTEIRLEGLTSDIRRFLETPGEKMLAEDFDHIGQLSGIDQLAWHLGLICPVPYINDYPIPAADLNRQADAVLIERSRRLLRDRFSVLLNGKEVRRHIILPRYKERKHHDSSEYRRLMKRGLGYEVNCFRSSGKGPVKYQGYVMVQAKQLFPIEVRGLLIRMRGVGIGAHKTFNLAGSSIATMLPAMSGEIWVESGLDDALQFDRESFREDHPNFVWFRERVAEEISRQSRGFRTRSTERTKLKKQEKEEKYDDPASPLTPPGVKGIPYEPSRETPIISRTVDAFLTPEIFRDCPTFIQFLVPQVNGCWDRGWFEACALTTRRLLETLIVHLYESRGWADEIRSSHGYMKLQNLVDKVCGDGRVGLGKKSKEALEHLKMIGDVAAHDYRVRVRKSDLEQKRTELRLTCERLIFIAQIQGK